MLYEVITGLEIAHVMLTHFHADFLAGHLELRERTGATIVITSYSIHYTKLYELAKVRTGQGEYGGRQSGGGQCTRPRGGAGGSQLSAAPDAAGSSDNFV